MIAPDNTDTFKLYDWFYNDLFYKPQVYPKITDPVDLKFAKEAYEALKGKVKPASEPSIKELEAKVKSLTEQIAAAQFKKAEAAKEGEQRKKLLEKIAELEKELKDVLSCK